MQGVIETEAIKERYGHGTVMPFKYVPEYTLAPGTQNHCLLSLFPFFDHHIDKVEIYSQRHCTASVKLALKVSSYLPSQLSFIIVLYLNVYLCIF